MSALMQSYNRFPFELVSGEGMYLTDNQGKAYLDLTAGIGVCNLGYNNAALNAAVVAQLGKIWHTSNLYQSQLQESVAEKLIQGADKKVFFCNSGTEANEAAIKLARKYRGKNKILSFHHSFHGRSLGALSVTGNEAIKEGFGALLSDIVFADYNNPQAIEILDKSFAAVIFEVIQGEGGLTVAERQWVNALAEKAQSLGVLLIIDEVQTGMGRTGKLFAYQHLGLAPDIVTLAKGIANGLPCGAVIAKTEVAQAFSYGAHGSTFGGNPIAMAAANEVLNQLTPEFLAQVAQKGERFYALLKEALENNPKVLGISGKGLMLGVHLAEDLPVKNVLEKLHQQGVLALSARGNTLRLLPPLIISEAEFTKGVAEINKAL